MSSCSCSRTKPASWHTPESSGLGGADGECVNEDKLDLWKWLSQYAPCHWRKNGTPAGAEANGSTLIMTYFICVDMPSGTMRIA